MLTNYHWSREAPVRSSVRAGSRRADIFTGIDVFGRGTYGGGGFHTHVALRAIKQGGTSAALFAPGWTVESCPPDITRTLDIEERFWTGPKGKFGRHCVAQYFRERAVVTSLPFSTNFNPGWGPCLYSKGEVASKEKWYDLSKQSIQPSYLRAVVIAGGRSAVSMQISHSKGWSGSGSMQVRFAFSPSRIISNTFAFLRMFVASLSFPEKSRGQPMQSLTISYTFQAAKKQSANRFGLVLLFSNPPRAVALVSKESQWQTSKMAQRIQVLKKYVPLTCIEPHQSGIRGGSDAKGTDRKWWRRSFKIDSSITSGQKLAEVLCLVGDPPTIPASTQPSPFMSPGGFRMSSRFTSRYASRTTSRHGSRYGSRSTSRNTSRRGSPSRTPPSKKETVLIDERENGHFRDALEEVRERDRAGHRSGDFGEDFNDHIGLKSMRVRNESYAAAFMTEGTVDFSALEYNVDRIEGMQSGASSRAMSRFGSRFGTPGASRYGTPGGSRFGSRYASRTGSRYGSRAGSRGGSPPQTPRGTAIATGLEQLPLAANLASSRRESLLSMGKGGGKGDDLRASTQSLKVLKTALMQAAGSMAGEVDVVDGKIEYDKGEVEDVWLGEIEICAAEEKWKMMRRKVVID
eukprot:Plantae.Rhodophyta-Hildenbrandia_rubra.ctg3805.p1 GENE.Plantae.Rhodophyta-Hildenbrandia_rubra.ctg3805~~Plantae.Rhodophyta-Hildenbrandia_rubra.ctg3805.p1  ORF type:complete len:631 (-),score=106.79 Plantae.Rhodophyta-Hildenbrandia_rubra.ctg3805:7706-9598(-)